MRSILDVTADEVIQAYVETGMRPVSGRWVDGSNGACAIGVLAIQNGASEGRIESSPNVPLLANIDHIGCFTQGFDGLGGIILEETFLHGHRIREAVNAFFNPSAVNSEPWTRISQDGPAVCNESDCTVQSHLGNEAPVSDTFEPAVVG